MKKTLRFTIFLKINILIGLISYANYSFGQLPPYLPSNGLVAWYPFNGNANDESGNGNNGIVNGATLSTDRNGNANSAYYFSSNSCNTRIDANVNTNTINGQISVSLWLSRTGNGCRGPRVFEAWPGSNNEGHMVMTWSPGDTWPNSWQHRVQGSSPVGIIATQNTGVAIPNNQWTNMIYTNDGITAKIYQDGILICQVQNPVNANIILASNIAIGRMNHPAWDAFEGKIDDFGIWNRALTTNEVQTLYDSRCTISQNLIPQDTLLSCGIDSVMLDAGAGFTSYSWSNSATTQTTSVSSSGMYYITATNSNGCSAIDSVYVSLINAEIEQVDTTICMGDSMTLSVSNSGPLSGAVNQGLVGWWPFNGNANDESGNGNNGTVNGAVLSADRFGSSNSAFIFDGVNDQISVGNSSSLSFSSFTISCWVNKDNQTIYLPGIISKCSPTNQGWYLATTANQNHNLIWQGGGTSGYWGCASSPLNALDWIYLAAVYSPTSVKLFVNGVLIDSNSTQSGLINTTYPLTFGYKNGDSFFGGQIDDIGIWNRVLTNNEILSLYLSANHQYQWSTGDTTASINVSPAQTTTYYVTITDGVGSCTDSVTVTVNNNAGTDIQTACDTYTWIDGVTYTASTSTPTFTLTNVAGCDSVVTLNLTINNSNTGTDNQIACDSYTWIDGITYTASTSSPTFTLTNAAGCDSVVTLNLTINNSNIGTDTQIACDSYTWIDGITYTASTTSPTFTLTNVAGCDSVVTLNLTINNSNTGTDNQTACDSYTWIDGITYTASTTTPTFTLPNAVGCDSVITLNLTINNSSASSSAVTACDSYTWLQNNVTYTTSGAYTDTIPNAAGCDSVITLNLTINNATASSSAVTSCDSYTWLQNNVTYTTSGAYTDTIPNAVGCDSVITLNLTVDTLDLSITNINDSLVSNDATSASYQWINCDSNNAIIAGATNQGYQPTMSGNYAVILTKGACIDTTACENVIISNTIESKLNANFSLYPNPTRGTVYLELSNNPERGSIIQIYTLTGQLVKEVNIQNKKTLIDISQLERSVYFFKYGNTTKKIVLTN